MFQNSLFQSGLLIENRGCVTPQVIANLKTLIEDDVEIFDGYEDLPEADQEKIATAIKEGHVADEDWVGVSASLYFCNHENAPSLNGLPYIGCRHRLSINS
jgi:hypothetical protein